MEAVITEAPNREYLELTFTKETATGKGMNERFIMENTHDGNFQITSGRIGIKIGCHKPRVWKQIMEDWDKTYITCIERGYTLFSEKKLEDKVITQKMQGVDGKTFKPLLDKAVSRIIERLLNFSNHLMEEEYTIRVENVSDEMLKRGKEILDFLADNYKDLSVAEFNGKLKVLYAVIPRRIDILSKKLAKRTQDFTDIIASEQELYDVLVSQIRGTEVKAASSDKTITEAYGLEMREVTEEEEQWIRKRLGREGHRYVRAWRVTNLATEERFDAFCKKNKFSLENGKVERLFHGSRSENFWSIITTGLTINPKGVVITGKMFGNGTYFAPDACKSMGYTDRRGSKWANGGNETGFLGIYKVAVGNPAAPSSAKAYNYASLSKQGYHSVWCKRGGATGLRMDEVVVYQDCQDTIEYLIEVGM